MVYVISRGFDMEGNSLPLAAYDNMEDAEDWVRTELRIRYDCESPTMTTTPQGEYEWKAGEYASSYLTISPIPVHRK